MPKFVVYVPEVHLQKVEIDAADKEEALLLVMNGEGEQVGKPEYSYTLDDENEFIVTDDEGNF